ncbi:hypothetical protein OIU76_005714 [Salix suchowensis]|nr:hypothetical protein OIU78_015606 [Salix suchowensis]KAJ6344033.1 hypothetical protein OIU76_005714 [Salix suchowensis]
MNMATLPYLDDAWVPCVPQSLINLYKSHQHPATNLHIWPSNSRAQKLFDKILQELARMESVEKPTSNRCNGTNGKREKEQSGSFQMPVHYPRYTRANYETMPEWKIDCLLREYGLPVTGDLEQKRKYAMGAFLWSH